MFSPFWLQINAALFNTDSIWAQLAPLKISASFWGVQSGAKNFPAEYFSTSRIRDFSSG